MHQSTTTKQRNNQTERCVIKSKFGFDGFLVYVYPFILFPRVRTTKAPTFFSTVVRCLSIHSIGFLPSNRM